MFVPVCETVPVVGLAPTFVVGAQPAFVAPMVPVACMAPTTVIETVRAPETVERTTTTTTTTVRH